MQQFAHWIDGKAREASTGGWLDVFDPATGKPFARAAKGSPDDVEAAVSAAQAAFPAWSSLPATERSRWLEKLADARSEEHTSELQSLMRISYAVFCLNKKNTNSITRRIHDRNAHKP